MSWSYQLGQSSEMTIRITLQNLRGVSLFPEIQIKSYYGSMKFVVIGFVCKERGITKGPK